MAKNPENQNNEIDSLEAESVALDSGLTIRITPVLRQALAEIDLCGHKVDHAYTIIFHEAVFALADFKRTFGFNPIRARMKVESRGRKKIRTVVDRFPEWKAEYIAIERTLRRVALAEAAGTEVVIPTKGATKDVVVKKKTKRPEKNNK